MIDPDVFASHVLAQYASEKGKFLINPHANEEYLAICEVRDILREMHNYYIARTLDTENEDKYENVTLWKTGQGGNWLVNKHSRYYVYVTTTVTTVLNITTPFGPSFLYTLQPAGTNGIVWYDMNFPENTSIILDSTNTLSQSTIFVKYTNRK